MSEDTIIAIGKRLVLSVMALFLFTQGLRWYLDCQFEQRTGMTIQEIAK